ncbi:MAG: GNAT family N-acetyltransferase [Gammaproteobacteria bacterium]|nr:GNAT family N-acetyltransferase [Gammaproteobacteria bacterium]
MRIRVLNEISEVAASDWNAFAGNSNPFLRHEFIHALEASGCASRETGWQPCHLLLLNGEDRPAAAMPLYIKSHSRGEFVFDWAWASAYQRAGHAYYPKLLSAVPFTPVTGPRFLQANGEQQRERARSMLLAAAVELGERLAASSLHCLFPSPEDAEWMKQKGMMLRTDCQFHWKNEGYGNFGEFLRMFSAAKRKKVNRERRRVREAGIAFETLTGDGLTPGLWETLYPLYAASYLKRGQPPYLNRNFFERITRSMPEAMVLFVARLDGKAIALAICFRGDAALYGRYWGSAGFHHSLHFETCYYQGIDYCVREGLALFDPGVQGEHKLARGFDPETSFSTHWVRHEGFANALTGYLAREREQVARYVEMAGEHTPFKQAD